MAGPIRQQIDIPSLERYIDQNVPEIKTPLDVKQFGYGQSNPTYLLKDTTGTRYVLRKRPPGKLLSQTAHRVDREYRIIHGLESTDVAVPKTFGLCEDKSVVGTAFYIMEFLDGRIFEDPAMPGVDPKERMEMWHDAVRTLGKFHRVDPASVNLSTFGKPTGFYNRQLRLFKTLSEDQAQAVDVDTKEAVGKIPYFDEMVAFFSQEKTQPYDRGTFIHGDYKIDNVIFHKTEPKVIGILDWEMSTIGHPLSDLANLLTPFVTAGNKHAQAMGNTGTGAAKSAFLPGKTEGLPTRDQCLSWYRETAGWDPVSDMAWGDAFGVYRGAIIMQGIGARYAVRQASSERAKDYGDAMKPYGYVAWDLVQKCMESRKVDSKL